MRSLLPALLLTLSAPTAAQAGGPCINAHEELGVDPFPVQTSAGRYLLLHRGGVDEDALAAQLQAADNHYRGAGFSIVGGPLPVVITTIPGETVGGFTAVVDCGWPMPYIVFDRAAIEGPEGDAIVAHEVFHAVQSGYAPQLWDDPRPEQRWLLEGAAAWAEGFVAPNAERAERFGRAWLDDPSVALHSPPPSLASYGASGLLASVDARLGGGDDAAGAGGWHRWLWEGLGEDEDGYAALDEVAAERGAQDAWSTWLSELAAGGAWDAVVAPAAQAVDHEERGATPLAWDLSTLGGAARIHVEPPAGLAAEAADGTVVRAIAPSSGVLRLDGDWLELRVMAGATDVDVVVSETEDGGTGGFEAEQPAVALPPDCSCALGAGGADVPGRDASLALLLLALGRRRRRRGTDDGSATRSRLL